MEDQISPADMVACSCWFRTWGLAIAAMENSGAVVITYHKNLQLLEEMTILLTDPDGNSIVLVACPQTQRIPGSSDEMRGVRAPGLRLFKFSFLALV